MPLTLRETRLFSYQNALYYTIACTAWCMVVNNMNAACSESCFICLVQNELTMLARVRRYTERKEKCRFSVEGRNRTERMMRIEAYMLENARRRSLT